MATEIETTEMKTEITTSDNLKSVLQSLTDQMNVIKGLANTVRGIIKDTDRQSKELEKLKNKKSRVKTERSATALPSGITKPVSISDELAKFLGVAPGTLVPRNEVTKGVSGFVKENGLSDPTNKQKFILDDRDAAKKLRTLLGNPAEDVTYFNLQRYLKPHYIQAVGAATPADSSASSSKPTTDNDAGESAKKEKEKTVVKKVVVVKKKKSELTEEN